MPAQSRRTGFKALTRFFTGSVVAGVVIIDAVKTKENHPSASRTFFIIAIVVFTFSLISSFAAVIIYAIAPDRLAVNIAFMQEPAQFQSTDNSYEQQEELTTGTSHFAYHLFISVAVSSTAAMLFAILVIALSVINLRTGD